MIQAKDKINRFSKSEAHVLITGESGVGKGLAANAIHQLSPRSQRPFLEINAGAIPATLFESELFGVRKGAFTGATETREGLFQSADGGTLFLDEIAEVPLEAQSKLLRVLDSGEIRPVGETRSRKVNVRLIAATNQDLEERVESKTFRQDLYYRLSILLLPMPSLRERPEDIPLLAEYFLNRLKIQGNGSRRLSSEAQIWLMAQKWPGNVRELKNVLERAVLLSDQEEIGRAELSAQPKEGSRESGSVFKLAKKRQIETFEKNYVTNLLKECGGNVSKAAEKAGLARRNFQALIKKYKLNPALHRKKP
jgi:DNA-binding NtrC family response regulator